MRRKHPLALLLCALLLACGNPSPRAQDRPKTIGFVFIGDRDDLGYNQAIWEASESLARALPDTRVLRVPNVPETQAAEQAMQDLIGRGATVIFATSYGYRDAAYRVAKSHPGVVVLHQGGVEGQPPLDNFGTYWGTVHEPVYESGIVAGGATRTGKLGFVAAFPIPAVLSNVNAFLLGARTVRPDVTLRIAFTGSWCLPDAQRRTAQQLIAAGADVLTQHQDCTGTILDAAEQAGVSSVGYHQDGSLRAPKGYLVGAVWSWSKLLVDIVRTIRRGEFTASPYNGDFRGGLSTGDNPFVLSELSALVRPAIRAKVAAADARMRTGWSPFTGPITDRHGVVQVTAGRTPSREQIDRMDYLLEGVIGVVPGGKA